LFDCLITKYKKYKKDTSCLSLKMVFAVLRKLDFLP